MENENQSIHDFDIDLICEYFSGLERQGPGSPEATCMALGFVESLSDESRIADVGCGTGGQTMVLAAHAPGQFVGVDLFPAFIDLFNANAGRLQLAHRVTGMVGSMDSLPFEDESLDLIWSEGAIYNIGFVQGLTEWRRFLKPNGYIAVSEASWFTKERPAEIDAYWKTAYPGIDTIPNKVAQMQDAGYVPVASFILPETCWIDHFYAPQRRAQEIFMEKHRDSKAAREFIENERREAEMYRKYKAFYGYAFYIGKKR